MRDWPNSDSQNCYMHPCTIINKLAVGPTEADDACSKVKEKKGVRGQEPRRGWENSKDSKAQIKTERFADGGLCPQSSIPYGAAPISDKESIFKHQCKVVGKQSDNLRVVG